MPHLHLLEQTTFVLLIWCFVRTPAALAALLLLFLKLLLLVAQSHSNTLFLYFLLSAVCSSFSCLPFYYLYV
ncbi:hypothetical protein V1520DRAFT_349533 [Lipomyces starkeyi]